ncbi:MAG: hypothetical protein OXL97_08975 [Chloroflexota bacterium]|nr:hypothetical protein [Chloroflexota bacterium]MDE2883472.1 hypothetical protein [Chloroflexota bacterium]
MFTEAFLNRVFTISVILLFVGIVFGYVIQLSWVPESVIAWFIGIGILGAVASGVMRLEKL